MYTCLTRAVCDERATQLCAVAARQLEAVRGYAFDAKFYLMLDSGSLQLHLLLAAVDVVRATFTEPRILEELAMELKISGQEVQTRCLIWQLTELTS